MMDGDRLADEILREMGGRVYKGRREAFRRLCRAIVRHIQVNAQVNTTGADPQGGTVLSSGKVR